MPFAWLRRRDDLPLTHLRLIAIALVAVLLPALTLLVLQYRSLSEVEQKTRIAVQENLRKAAEGVAWNIQGDLDRVADELFLPAPAMVFVQKRAPWTKDSVQAVFHKHPEIQQIFLVINGSKKSECDNVAYVYTPDRIFSLSRSQWAEDPDIGQAIEAHQKGDFLFAATPAAARSQFCYWQDPAGWDNNGRQDETSYISYCLIEPGSNREVGFAGMRLDMAQVRHHYLPNMVSYLSRSARRSSGSADLMLGVLDEHGRQICASAPGAARNPATATLAPVFPRWQATAGFVSTDVDALAHANFEKGLWFTILVAAVLLAGIAMIVGAAARELRLAEVKQTFVSNVSHELKTPLALIRLFAETLELGRAKTDEKAREYYRIIHHESRRLSQLIDNILDFSRMEAGSREYSFVGLDLACVTREVIERFEYHARAARFDLETQIGPGLPRINGDPEAISLAILNLLNNAVKYSDRIKHITVSVQARDGGAAIEVADQGIGIPLTEQKRIFEKFYRVCTGLVHDTKGSGLGLALVKHIVEAHAGRVSVVSAPGKGSRFTIWLPAVAESNDDRMELAEGGDLVAQSVDH